MENTLDHVTLEEKLALEQLLKDMRAKKENGKYNKRRC